MKQCDIFGESKHTVTLRSIYFAFVHPHLLYGIEIYGNAGTSQLDKLLKLNNKLMRILQKETCILK